MTQYQHWQMLTGKALSAYMLSCPSNFKQGYGWKETLAACDCLSSCWIMSNGVCMFPPGLKFHLITDAQWIQRLHLTRTREHRNVDAPITTQMTRLVQDSELSHIRSGSDVSCMHACNRLILMQAPAMGGERKKMRQNWFSHRKRLCKPQNFTFTVCIISASGPERGEYNDCQAEYESKRQLLTGRTRFEFNFSRWLGGWSLLMNSTLRLSGKLKMPATDASAGFFSKLYDTIHSHTLRQKLYWFQPSETPTASPWWWTKTPLLLHYLRCAYYEI